MKYVLKSLFSGFLKTLRLPLNNRFLVFKIVLLLYKFKIKLLYFQTKSSLPSLYPQELQYKKEKSKLQYLEEKKFKELKNLVMLLSKRLVGVDNCLLRCLALFTLLQKYKHDIKLKIGVRKKICSNLEAHAWLEDSQGNIIFEELIKEESFKELKSVAK